MNSFALSYTLSPASLLSNHSTILSRDSISMMISAQNGCHFLNAYVYFFFRNADIKLEDQTLIVIKISASMDFFSVNSS